MKRSVAVCMVAGLLLATSTAAFATPAPFWDVTYSSNAASLSKTGGTITWFQGYAGKLNPLDPAYAGGTLTQAITSATLTVGAVNVWSGGSGGPDNDVLSIQSPSAWESLGALATAATYNGTSTTVYGWPTGTNYSFPLTGATGIDWLAGTTGFNAKVVIGNYPTNQADNVTSAVLAVTTHYTWTADPQPPQPPAIPAPGAILLCSMGAGLVSWLRARKAL